MSGVVLAPKANSDFDISEIERIATEILNCETPSLFTIQRAAKSKSVSAKNQPPVEVIRMPSGLQVCYHPRNQSHVFSVHASVLGGLRLELAHPIASAEKDWGASYMMSLAWTKGTSKLDSRRISEIIEGRAANLEGFAGRNSVGIQMTGLARDWNSLSHVMTDVLLDPTFPSEEVEHSRRIAETPVRSIEDHTSQLCSKLFLETLFSASSLWKDDQWQFGKFTNDDIGKLKSFHEAWILPKCLVISVSGAVKDSALESWIYQLDQRAQALASRTRAPDLPGNLMSEPDLKAPRWVEKSLSREQCHLLIGGLGSQIHSEDRFALRILQTLLGGQSGRLFIELREKKSLAYTVSPVSFEGLERGYIGTYIACSPQKKDEAVAGIRTVLEKLADKGPSAQEMARAKEFFLGRRSMDLQSDPSIAGHFGLETLYQVPHLSNEQVIKKIRAINAKQVSAVCRKYLVEPNMVTSAVG